MRKIHRELLWACAFVLTAALLLGLAARALRPVRSSYGATWAAYLAEPKDSLDYLYLGSSYAYCDVDPACVYAESGLSGYVMAGPGQTLSQTYWYLREALKTQTPRLVLLEATALHFEKYEAYSQINVGYMPAGLNKLGAIFTAAEPELRLGLLFDLYFYHSRWSEVTLGEVLRALRGAEPDPLRGFTPVTGTADVSAGGQDRAPQSDAVYQENLADLLRIAGLCAESDISLAVVFHPTYSQLPPATRQAVQADLQEKAPEVAFYDWSEDGKRMGLDPARHYYDPGHLNRDGAEVFSHWLGSFLTAQAGDAAA